MHIPTYWAQARLRHESRPTHGITIQRWGWSDTSQEAAQAHADARARQALEAARNAALPPGEPRMEWKNEYALDGFTTPIREEVLQRRDDTVMTRNSYGAHCLNTARVAIADVDLPQPPRALRFPAVTLVLLALAATWLAQLAPHKSLSRMVGTALVVLLLFLLTRRVQRWWETRQARRRAASDPAPARAMERVQAFHDSHPDWGLRVYETPNGLRVIVTHADFAADDPAVEQLFDALQVDPLYALLCERQQCFRARVSGKPWRMGLTGLSTTLRRWPASPSTLEERRQWALAYDEKAKGFAACRLMQQLGDTRICTAAEAFVQWHDEASQARSNLPLA
ncbi:Uncharacterised protein [Delftia tsuruhatensis]|uniref:hypothetical protein n=1 Tax=Delftia tsuruhatensis TaxID=180282 RepID=UPI001E818B13|nr:hypothetical protein [Delftia tsuruhatensis]CAB5697495.1 Uncharacterised protein [Delftia tsuruhatensis]CAC9678765.1 Uncharacterised protein [Delftia tsuruhatensis]